MSPARSTSLIGAPLRQVPRPMRVLIGCEFSGRVRDAFLALGHEAVSCDIIPSERPGPHIQDNVLNIADSGRWDLGIFHPPCTYLAVSGAKWFSTRQKEQLEALKFVESLMVAKIPRIAIENPISIISTQIRKPDQIFCPTSFGVPIQKRTCLWLKNLPKLIPTKKVLGNPSIHTMGGIDRQKDRSRTSFGVARAMAEQWGKAW